MFSAAVVASILSVVSAYSKCSPSDVKGPITIPINKVLVITNIEVSGNIEIVDGCTFKVTGFNLKNSAPARWYGGNGTSTDGVTLSETPVSGAAEQTFTFRNVAGAEVSFRDFDQFRLLVDSSQILIATAQVPSSVRANLGQPTTGTNTGGSTTIGTNTGGSTTRSTGGSTTVAQSTQPASDSSAQMIGSGMLGLLMAALI